MGLRCRHVPGQQHLGRLVEAATELILDGLEGGQLRVVLGHEVDQVEPATELGEPVGTDRRERHGDRQDHDRGAFGDDAGSAHEPRERRLVGPRQRPHRESVAIGGATVEQEPRGGQEGHRHQERGDDPERGEHAERAQEPDGRDEVGQEPDRGRGGVQQQRETHRREGTSETGGRLARRAGLAAVPREQVDREVHPEPDDQDRYHLGLRVEGSDEPGEPGPEQRAETLHPHHGEEDDQQGEPDIGGGPPHRRQAGTLLRLDPVDGEQHEQDQRERRPEQPGDLRTAVAVLGQQRERQRRQLDAARGGHVLDEGRQLPLPVERLLVVEVLGVLEQQHQPHRRRVALGHELLELRGDLVGQLFGAGFLELAHLLVVQFGDGELLLCGRHLGGGQVADDRWLRALLVEQRVADRVVGQLLLERGGGDQAGGGAHVGTVGGLDHDLQQRAAVPETLLHEVERVGQLVVDRRTVVHDRLAGEPSEHHGEHEGHDDDQDRSTGHEHGDLLGVGRLPASHAVTCTGCGKLRGAVNTVGRAARRTHPPQRPLRGPTRPEGVSTTGGGAHPDRSAKRGGEVRS